MKIISSICLALIIACQIGSYPCFYFMGRLEHSMWDFFNPFFTGPIDVLLLLALIIVCIISLCLRKSRLWAASTLLGGLAVIASVFVLPSPGTLVIYGLRNRVMQGWSIDDLHHFAHDVHQKIPNIDVTENDPKIGGGDYDKLQEKYHFMKWGIGGKGNPYIYEREGALHVEWGGALPGHWGFSIALDGKSISPDPDMRILRMSDDIYFYHGD